MEPQLAYTSMNSSLALGSAIYPYTFCFPNLGAHPFYVGIRNDVPVGQDAHILGKLLEGTRGDAVPANENLPQGLPWGFRLYDISSYIHPYIREKLGTAEAVPGPNCYHAVLSILMGDKFEGRYVHDEELAYYFTRDFKWEDGARQMMGSALIYVNSYAGSGVGGRGFVGAGELDELQHGMRTFGFRTAAVAGVRKASVIPSTIGHSMIHSFVKGRTPELPQGDFEPPGGGMGFASPAEAVPWKKIIPGVDPGVHGAVTLIAGMVFQKGCFGRHCAYRIVPADRAMSSIELGQPRPFEPRQEPDKDENFTGRTYVRTERDSRENFGFNEELSGRLSAYVVLIGHYIDRIRAIKDRTWGDFKDNRIDLLSVENLWRLLTELQDAMRVEPNPINALLRIDPEIAESILELTSLKWQYQAMVDAFAAFSNRWTTDRINKELAELYRGHYIHPDGDDFRREIEAHLAMRGVSTDRWDAIAARVIGEVKTYNPVDFAQSNGGRGIPFGDIVDRAVAE